MCRSGVRIGMPQIITRFRQKTIPKDQTLILICLKILWLATPSEEEDTALWLTDAEIHTAQVLNLKFIR